MGWTFPLYSINWLDAANFLDSQSMLSFFLKARLDALAVGSRQYLFGHRGSVGSVSLRKDNGTPEKFRVSLTTSTGQVRTLDSTIAPTASTVYTLGVTWQANTVGGMKLYIDGALDNSTDTTSQTDDYGTEGGQDLHFSHLSYNNSPGQCSLEDFMAWTGRILTLTEFQLLGRGYPWWDIGLTRPQLWYPFHGTNLASVIDKSGRGRDLNNIDTSPAPTNGGVLGLRPRAILHTLSGYKPTVSTGSPENPWGRYSEVFHPQAAELLVGLTNGQAYEFSIIAVDQSGNESERSDIAEATPNVPALPTLTYRVPWKRPRRISKYRSAQQ